MTKQCWTKASKAPTAVTISTGFTAGITLIELYLVEGVNYGNGGFPRSDREVVCGREYVGDGARLGGTKDLAAHQL